jgi:hypothetical protein
LVSPEIDFITAVAFLSQKRNGCYFVGHFVGREAAGLAFLLKRGLLHAASPARLRGISRTTDCNSRRKLLLPTKSCVLFVSKHPIIIAYGVKP